ncbi:hypothetical protein GGR58DRAFT_508279 [Xylaria digitata]|nr:hypothetical protein GGR58DRAFT_508279 [Xylaria digitata]
MSSDKRVCLAYSGGLDTSVILRWLILEGYTVVALTTDCGQNEDFAEVEKKALDLGAERIVIANLQQQFVDELIFPAIQCNAIYESRTGKGNDQVRFELAWQACDPSLSVIAPWRLERFMKNFQGRQDFLKFAAESNIPVSSTPKAPWS